MSVRAPMKENLARFAHRQMCENDKMRNRIYDYLRARFNMPKVSLPVLREVATSLPDAFAIQLLDYAQHLEKSRVEIIKAALKVRS